jgi:hypothetical protein
MGLTYVVFTTDEGTMLVPNLTLLAAAIVRSPQPQPQLQPQPGQPTTTQPPVGPAPPRERPEAPDPTRP